MNALVTCMTQVLSNTFEMYTRAHGMHWNVTGMFFPVYHDFFGNLYEELYGSIDKIAEETRALGAFVPYGTQHVSSNNVFPETKQLTGSVVKEMLDELEMCNALTLKSLNTAFQEAQKAGAQGLMNFLADRIDAHKKHDWMIKSCLDQRAA